jgi:hypothetical protein
MRALLVLWALPLVLFWSWYGLSAHDLNFGTRFFSREVHDLVFQIYGNTLGMAPREVPAAIASATALDTALIMALLSWRWRASWLPQARALLADATVAGRRRRRSSDLPF